MRLINPLEYSGPKCKNPHAKNGILIAVHYDCIPFLAFCIFDQIIARIKISDINDIKHICIIRRKIGQVLIGDIHSKNGYSFVLIEHLTKNDTCQNPFAKSE